MTSQQGDERTTFLAAAVFESLMETALEENRRMNSDRAEAMLVRAYNMYRHPLLLSLQADAKSSSASSSGSDGVAVAVKGEYPCYEYLHSHFYFIPYLKLSVSEFSPIFFSLLFHNYC